MTENIDHLAELSEKKSEREQGKKNKYENKISTTIKMCTKYNSMFETFFQ